MKRGLIIVFTAFTGIFLPILANAQDPGQPDTIYIDCTPQNEFGAPESKVRFDVIFKTDNSGIGNDVTGVCLWFNINATNKLSAKPVLDTTVAATYSGTDVSTWDVLTAFVPSAGGDPSSFPIFLALGMVEFTELGLHDGTYTLAHLVLKVKDTCTICIDTTHSELPIGCSFTTSNVSSYLAIWLGEFCCQVTPYQNQSGPICHSPDSIPELSGSKISFQVTAYDSDTIGCYLISDCSFDILENPASETSATFTGPCSGSFTNMIFDWQTSPNDSGTFHIVFTFRDTCGGVETCTTIVTLFSHCIFATIGQVNAQPGNKIKLPLEIFAPITDVGGFNFCIEYDPVLMTFLSVERGEFFNLPGPFPETYHWNYLVWRNQPSTVIHKFELCIIGVGRIYYYGGTCLPRGERGVLYLHFRLSNNELFNCFYTPVRWKKLESNCIFNSFSDCSGNSVIVFDDTLFYNPKICDPEKLYPKQTISNCAKALDGAVVFTCGPHLGPGDINLNGFHYEIGDAVLFANYFIFGIEVFNTDPELRERQIFATDINYDGTTLTIADLVYLLRILSGDTSPLGQPSKILPYTNTIDLMFNDRLAVVSSTIDLGAIYFVFKGEATKIEPLVSDLETKWHARNGETKVLIYSFGNAAKINAGNTNLFKVYGEVKLEKVEAAEFMGLPVNVNISSVSPNIPASFSLSQNYPNPFNNSTTIKFALPTEGMVSLKIYNVTGQLVKEFNEFKSAGYHSITWDGTNSEGEKVSSGVYLYKLETENFTEVKKMTLLK